MYLSILKYHRHIASCYQHFTLLLNKKPKEKCQQDDYTFTFHCTSEEQLHFNPIEKKCYKVELKIQSDSPDKKNLYWLYADSTMEISSSLKKIKLDVS